MRILARITVAGMAAFAVAALAAAGVLAGGNPDRTFSPAPPDVSGNLCGATGGLIVAHVSVDREYIKTYTFSDGTVRYEVNGTQIDTFTGNGKTVTINASGPATFTFYPDGTVVQAFRGHTAYLAPTGGLFLFTGLVLIDTSGNVISHNGGTTDICALLAA